MEAACLRLAETFNLLFAGIDLKQTPEGEFFCFEVNPCPGFLYYERHTRQPISTALADLLHRPAQSVRTPSRRHDVEFARGESVQPRRKTNGRQTHQARQEALRIAKADRPEVRLKSDTPLSRSHGARPRHSSRASSVAQVRISGTARIGRRTTSTAGIKWKDAKEGKETKEVKDKDKESKEFKDGKEKREVKEIKAEKLELDGGGVFEPASQADPRIEQVIRALSGMSAKVDQLSDQVEGLKKRKG